MESMDELTHRYESTIRALSQYNDRNVPLNEPPIRMWELNENSTLYDRMIAAPTDENLVQFWTGWSAIMLTTGVVTLAIWLPLIFNSRQVQRNPFNWYLIYLITPDMMVAWICGISCLRNAQAGHFTSVFACKFQSFYMVASIGANSWINLLVTRQLYRMLKAAQQFQPIPQPKPTQECLVVYVYAVFLAALAMFDAPWWPHKTRLTIGAACIPMNYDTVSTIFFYCVFFPLLFGIPLAYVCWAAYQIYTQKLLPPSGRRRLLAIYFFRIAAVFLIMWLPGLLLLFVTSAWLDPWVQWAGGAWSHLQGLVSAIVSLWKPDVWQAVKHFWTISCVSKVDQESCQDNGNTDTTNKSWWSNISILRRRPRWVTSSVYWSDRIAFGDGQARSNDNKGDKREKQDSHLVSMVPRSYVSSYRERDDELEEAAKAISCLDGRSNILVSDDSVVPQEIDDPNTNFDRLESIAEHDKVKQEDGLPHPRLRQCGISLPSDSVPRTRDDNMGIVVREPVVPPTTTVDPFPCANDDGGGVQKNVSRCHLQRESDIEECEDAPYKAIYIVPRNLE